MLPKKFTVLLIVLVTSFYWYNANAQLWSYIDWTPAKEKAFEKKLKKEAYKVVTHYDADKIPYDEMIYHLQSLDSSTYLVHVCEVPFTKVINIKCATDSLKISDCQGVDRLHFLRKNLFEIVYSPRGGSDDGYENVLLLAIKDGKFRIAMEMETMHDYDGPGFYGLYETHLTLTGDKPENYELTLKNHELRRYDRKSKNFDHYHTAKLKYNIKLNLFYTDTKTIKGKIWNDDSTISDKKVSGTFPMIRFGNEEYCFINDCWYEIGSDYQTKETTLYNFTH